jgi:hypothetical protein
MAEERLLLATTSLMLAGDSLAREGHLLLARNS